MPQLSDSRITNAKLEETPFSAAGYAWMLRPSGKGSPKTGAGGGGANQPNAMQGCVHGEAPERSGREQGCTDCRLPLLVALGAGLPFPNWKVYGCCSTLSREGWGRFVKLEESQPWVPEQQSLSRSNRCSLRDGADLWAA